MLCYQCPFITASVLGKGSVFATYLSYMLLESGEGRLVAGARSHAVVLRALSCSALGGLVSNKRRMTGGRDKYLSVLHLALLDDLLDDLLLVGGTELGLESLVGGAVEWSLLALPGVDVSLGLGCLQYDEVRWSLARRGGEERVVSCCDVVG